ncbi:MAG TPA: hypothetical protein VLJ58_06195 [Ramlibacter sp.]|nr:hypothetical protein [Ramlibacter sp.]
MNRCFKPALAALALWALAAQAQVLPPADAQHARLTIGTVPPDVLVNDRPDRLSPGSRIRNLNNMITLSASIAGKTFPVVYKRDAAGLVHDVWMLSAEEERKLASLGNDTSIEGKRRFAELLNQIFTTRR